MVLGCTTGAGQTTTTLLTGQLLAALRTEAVAVLDIGPGPGSLTQQARQIPRLLRDICALKGKFVLPAANQHGLALVVLNLKSRKVLRARAVMSYDPAVCAVDPRTVLVDWSRNLGRPVPWSAPAAAAFKPGRQDGQDVAQLAFAEMARLRSNLKEKAPA